MTDTRLLDKEWRVSHLYKIRDKKKNLITFKRNKAQKNFNENRHTRNIILKSRQLGFTTDEAVDMLDETLFEKNSESILIAQDLDKSKDIFDNKIKLAWDNFRLKDLYDIDLNSARRLKVGFRDGTFSSVVVDSSGRSGTFNRVHVTEYAKMCKNFPDRAKEILEGTIPSVPTDGRVDIESTAEEAFGLFYEIFWEAWNRKDVTLPTQFKAHFYNWRWDEEIETIQVIDDLPKEFRDYQAKHKLSDKEISYYYLKFVSLGGKSWATMRKEFPTIPEEAFMTGENRFFDQDIAFNLRTDQGVKMGNWTFYSNFKPGHRYCLGADVSEGVKRHNSTIVVLDLDYQFIIEGRSVQKPKVVAVYASNEIAPDLFAYEIQSGGQKYGNCIAGVERNNHGFATLTKLKEIYFNIYKDENEKLGWHTNLSSKPRMLHDLRTIIHEGIMEISDESLRQEVISYPSLDLNEANVDEEDETTGHYDRVIALAIAWQMRQWGTPAQSLEMVDDDHREDFNKFDIFSSF